MRLPGQLPLAQTQAQVVAQVPVAELVRLRVLVQAAVLAQARLRVLVQELELALGLQLELELVSAVEPPLVREPVQQPELAAIPMQAQKLRVSRQQELQQHRLPTVAQEQLPYLPALPMKAPCWGAPAW